MGDKIVFKVVGLLQIDLIVFTRTTVIIIRLFIGSAMIISVGIIKFQQLVISYRLGIRCANRIVETTGGLIGYQVLTTYIVHCTIGVIKGKR